MRLNHIIILLLTVVGFALRLLYTTHTHPFFDEYTTVLAARQILRHGWPLLPSGLFYEHGLLATYLIAPFTALFINTPLTAWEPAHWGLMLSRWPSVLLGTATIPLIYHIGCYGTETPLEVSPIQNPQSKIQNPKWLLAAGLFALSPEGMVWGGRARMYALATFLILLTVYWAYRGAIYPAPAKYRWYALLALLATLLTQFGALMLIPPLGVAVLVVGWLSYKKYTTPPPWFLQSKTIILEGIALASIIGVAVLVKRLGQPLGMSHLADTDPQSLPDTLLNTIAYQTTFHFTWADTLTFLARQFGVPHHFWLTVLTIVGALLGLSFWLANKQSLRKKSALIEIPTGSVGISPAGRNDITKSCHFEEERREISTKSVGISPRFVGRNDIINRDNPKLFPLFLWLIFGLILLEMVTLLEPFRRNPRYLAMYLPLFYLIAAPALFNFRLLLPRNTQCYTFITLILLSFFILIGFNDLRIAFLTPEPAYEAAFAYVNKAWQPGDALLTMNTPAAELYLGHVDGFTVQTEADQFLLNAGQKPVDRWVGVPWLGNVAAFNTLLNEHKRVWFVSDTIRQPVYFRGDWQVLLNNQLEQVWAHDNALVYRTRPDRIPLPSHPETLVKATLGDNIQLVGYTLQSPSTPQLTLFWQALTSVPTDYTVFLHLRNGAGDTVAQQDGLPVAGTYPTSRWQPGETIIDPIRFPLPADLPPGEYQFWGGLYRLDTLERLAVSNDTSGENAILLGAITLP